MNIFLFVTANEHERTAFEKKFIRHEERYILGKTYYLGKFGSYLASYIHIDEQGVTNPAATPLVGQLVNELHPVAVIMVGIAFGADENKQKIGDVLISDKILPYDSQKFLEDKTEYKEIPKEVGFQLLNAFREYREWNFSLPNSKQSVVYVGAVLTGSRLINNYEYRTQLLNDFADKNPIGGEMEAQGIYSIARLHGVVEWIIVKGICDWGYKKDNIDKEKNQETAAHAAVDYCFHVFSRDGVFDSLVNKKQETEKSRAIYINLAPTFESDINQLKPLSLNNSPNPMHYLSDGIGFYGRDEEISWLDRFCQTDETVQYTVVYGAGGVGKSKFLYEYIKGNINPDWRMCFVTENIITSLLSYADYRYPKNLLLVIDYASRHSEIIGKWLAKLTSINAIINKIRIVLIERHGQDGNSTSGVLNPWYEKLCGNTTQRRLLKGIEFGFLELNQITPASLGKMINDYIKTNYPKKQLGTEEISNIIEYASNGLGVNENQQSPLLILLITDAYISGQDYRDWNRTLLVQNYVERLLENWLVSLCDNDAKLYISLVRLLVFATVVNGFNINDDIPDIYSSDIVQLTENQLCKSILDGATGFADEVVHAIEPDIIGEFMVLNYLEKLITFKTKRKLIESFYYRPFVLSDFFFRCIDDFAETGTFDNFFRNYIELIKPPVDSELLNELYAFLLAKYFCHCHPDKKCDCLKIMKSMHIKEIRNKSHYIFGITPIYAFLLADLTVIKNIDEYTDRAYFTKAFQAAKHAIDELIQLSNEYSSMFPQILFAYTRALANFSYYSSENETHDCVLKVSALYTENHQKISGLAINYAMALNNYIMILGKTVNAINLAKAEDVIHNLENLYDLHVTGAINLHGMTVEIVNALSNPELRTAVEDEKKKFLEQANMYQEGVAIEYARGINNLIAFYTQMDRYEKAVELFDALKLLYDKHYAEMPEIKIEYAKALVNIIQGCKRDDANMILDELKQFYQTEKRERDVYMIRYAKALTNHLAQLIKDNVYCDDVDNTFNAVCSLYFENRDCSLDLTKCFALCLYYMFNILIRTQNPEKNGEELDTVYNMLLKVYRQSDPRIRETIGQYVEKINKMYSPTPFQSKSAQLPPQS